MAKKSRGKIKIVKKKKTSIGASKFTKWKQPGAHGSNRGYRKRPRGQGK